MMQYWHLLRHNPGYARLWTANAVSMLGDWFNTIVMLALVARYSEGSGLAVSGFLLARVLPPLLVSPYAGVLADRLPRKALMIASNLLRVGVVLGFLFTLSGPDRLWLVYALTITQFALAAFFDPAYKAIVPSLVERENLVIANTLGSITWSAMLTIGGLAGGVIAALVGTTGALVVDAATFLISALLIASIRDGHVQPAEDAAPLAPTNPVRDYVAGLRFAVRHPNTATTLIIKAGGEVGNVSTLMTVFATQIFVIGTDGTESLGIVYAVVGFGAVLGPLLLNRFNNGQTRVMRRLVTVGFAGMVVAWGVLSVAPNLFIVSLGLILHAMGGSANWTYSSVIIQKTTPDAFLGRIFSLDMAAFQLSAVINVILTGWLIDLFGSANIGQVTLLLGLLSLLPLAVWLAAERYTRRRQPAALPLIGD